MTKKMIDIDTYKTLNKSISGAENMEFMSNYFSQLLVDTLGIKGSAIYILNLETKELELLASFGLSTEYLNKGFLSADRSIPANLKGKPIIISDISRRKNLQYPEAAKKEGIRTLISIPIIFSNKVIGALRLYHSKAWNISKQDLDSLMLLAEKIGQALAYFRLYNAFHTIVKNISYTPPNNSFPRLSQRKFH